jgi:CelD/BcsL family acetyltransferase involved in cellulose biosynthesis
VLAFADGVLIAAASFARYGSTLAFAGRGASDYCAILIAPDLDDHSTKVVVDALLQAALTAAPRARELRLARMHPTSRALPALRDGQLHVTEADDAQAPVMAMDVVADRLAKKSMRRHARKLASLGEVRALTLTDGKLIADRLETLFEMHVARWQGTSSPSLFLRRECRAFYSDVTRGLGPHGALRYTEVHAGDRVVACHFGFSHGGRFVWYKPAFAPEFASYSPGEVLLGHLFERARDEGCEWFDFTIGAESFKLRFATEVIVTRRMHLTDSRSRYWFEQTKRRLRPPARPDRPP